MSLTVRSCIESSLYEMLLHRSACTILVFVEEKQTLWQLTVVETLGLKHVGCHSLIVTIGDESFDTLALVLLTDNIESIVERELLDRVEVFLLEIGSRNIIVGINECEHVLEHTAGSTRGWHELHHALSLSLIGIPRILVLLALCCIGGDDASANACSCL